MAVIKTGGIFFFYFRPLKTPDLSHVPKRFKKKKKKLNPTSLSSGRASGFDPDLQVSPDRLHPR